MGPVNNMGFTPMRFVASAGPEESQANVSSLAPITAIVDIFRVNNWKNLRSIKPKAAKRTLNFMRRKSKRNQESSWQQETNPLTMFYHADEKLRTTILALNRARNTSLGKFLQHIRRVHRAQKHLLATVYLIYSGINEQSKVSKEHRRHLPLSDQQELDSGFSEGIFFASQALTNGFRIRGIEYCTEDLIDPAKSLCAAMDALRFVFRTRAAKSTLAPYDDLEPVLIDFDRSWTSFEAAICSSYFQLGSNPNKRSRSHDLDMFTVLLSDTLIRAIELNLIETERVTFLDPEVMIFLPRLALFAGITHFSQLLNLTDQEKCFWWLKPHAPKLHSLQETLLALPISHLNRLEAMLAGSESPTVEEKVTSFMSIPKTLRGSPQTFLDLSNVPEDEADFIYQSYPHRNSTVHKRKESSCTQDTRMSIDEIVYSPTPEPIWDIESVKQLQTVFNSICRIADGLQTGSRAKHFLPLLQKVFTMHINQTDITQIKKTISLDPPIDATQPEDDVYSRPSSPVNNDVQVVVLVVENHHYHNSISQELESPEPIFSIPSSDQEDDSHTITSASSCSVSVYSSLRSSFSMQQPDDESPMIL